MSSEKNNEGLSAATTVKLKDVLGEKRITMIKDSITGSKTSNNNEDENSSEEVDSQRMKENNEIQVNHDKDEKVSDDNEEKEDNCSKNINDTNKDDGCSDKMNDDEKITATPGADATRTTVINPELNNDIGIKDVCDTNKDDRCSDKVNYDEKISVTPGDDEKISVTPGAGATRTTVINPELNNTTVKTSVPVLISPQLQQQQQQQQHQKQQQQQPQQAAPPTVEQQQSLAQALPYTLATQVQVRIQPKPQLQAQVHRQEKQEETPSSKLKSAQQQRRFFPRIKALTSPEYEIMLSSILQSIQENNASACLVASHQRSNPWNRVFHKVYDEIATDCSIPFGKNRYHKFKDKIIDLWVQIQQNSELQQLQKIKAQQQLQQLQQQIQQHSLAPIPVTSCSKSTAAVKPLTPVQEQLWKIALNQYNNYKEHSQAHRKDNEVSITLPVNSGILIKDHNNNREKDLPTKETQQQQQQEIGKKILKCVSTMTEDFPAVATSSDYNNSEIVNSIYDNAEERTLSALPSRNCDGDMDEQERPSKRARLLGLSKKKEQPLSSGSDCINLAPAGNAHIDADPLKCFPPLLQQLYNLRLMNLNFPPTLLSSQQKEQYEQEEQGKSSPKQKQKERTATIYNNQVELHYEKVLQDYFKDVSLLISLPSEESTSVGDHSSKEGAANTTVTSENVYKHLQGLYLLRKTPPKCNNLRSKIDTLYQQCLGEYLISISNEDPILGNAVSSSNETDVDKVMTDAES